MKESKKMDKRTELMTTTNIVKKLLENDTKKCELLDRNKNSVVIAESERVELI